MEVLKEGLKYVNECLKPGHEDLIFPDEGMGVL
jgi:hypothetical protein